MFTLFNVLLYVEVLILAQNTAACYRSWLKSTLQYRAQDTCSLNSLVCSCASMDRNKEISSTVKATGCLRLTVVLSPLVLFKKTSTHDLQRREPREA